MSESPEPQPVAPLSVGEQIDEAVRTLTEQSAWMRERLGEEDWRRLTRLRDAWAGCRYLFAWGLNILKIAAVLVGFGLVMTRLTTHSWRPERFEWWTDGGVLFVLGPALFALGWVGARVTEALLSRELERLTWRGHSPAAIAQALWADLHAKALLGQRREVEARAQLARERTAAPPWWRIEFRGAHLVGWTALGAVAAITATGWAAPDWLVSPAWATAVGGLLAKLVFWLLYRLTTSAAKVRRLHFYRWWARGPLPVGIALLPGLFMFVCIVLPAGQ